MNDRDISRWREWVHSSPVAVFILLAFLISWSIWGAARVLLPGASPELRLATHTVGLCGPTVAGLFLTGLLYGRRGVFDLLKRIVRWRVGIGWIRRLAAFSARKGGHRARPWDAAGPAIVSEGRVVAARRSREPTSAQWLTSI
jgi:hypothetical protein